VATSLAALLLAAFPATLRAPAASASAAPAAALAGGFAAGLRLFAVAVAVAIEALRRKVQTMNKERIWNI
jgi:hypothetical protein